MQLKKTCKSKNKPNQTKLNQTKLNQTSENSKLNHNIIILLNIFIYIHVIFYLIYLDNIDTKRKTISKIVIN